MNFNIYPLYPLYVKCICYLKCLYIVHICLYHKWETHHKLLSRFKMFCIIRSISNVLSIFLIKVKFSKKIIMSYFKIIIINKKQNWMHFYFIISTISSTEYFKQRSSWIVFAHSICWLYFCRKTIKSVFKKLWLL